MSPASEGFPRPGGGAGTRRGQSSSPRPAVRAQVKLEALLGSPEPLYFGHDGHSHTGRVRPLVATF
jgi:hypothetical protein